MEQEVQCRPNYTPLSLSLSPTQSLSHLAWLGLELYEPVLTMATEREIQITKDFIIAPQQIHTFSTTYRMIK